MWGSTNRLRVFDYVYYEPRQLFSIYIFLCLCAICVNVRETLSQLGEFFDAQLDGCTGMGLLYLVVHFSCAVFGATYTRMLEFNANGSPKS